MKAIRAAYAFDGAAFVPGGATVVIDGDRITAIHPGRLELPEAVEVTDYEGTLLPGLFDCHTHLVADSTPGGLERVGEMSGEAIDTVILASLRAHAAAGVTTVRDLGDRDYRTLGFRRRPGLPRVVAAGPPITTSTGHCHFLGGVVTGDLRSAVAERVERGVDVVKVMASGGFLTPGTDRLGAQFDATELQVLVEEAHRAGLPVLAHAHSLVAIENALDAGVDGIEHFGGLAAGGVQISDDLLAAVARRNVVVDLTMGIDRDLYLSMPAPPAVLVPMLALFNLRSLDELYDHWIRLHTRFREHGVTVVTGVDSGISPPKRHGNAWWAVYELVKAGYPAADALAAATSIAAEACGLGDQTGRLKPGLAADLLVVDGNLATDISALGKPLAVFVRGHLLRH